MKKKRVMLEPKEVIASRKRPFLLLELLIALTLFLFCAPFFIKDPLLLLNKEISSLEKMELQRMAENSFACIMGKLQAQEIDWKSFSEPKSKTAYIEMPEQVTVLSSKYKEKYKIWKIAEKEELPKTFRRVGIEIVFSPDKKGKKLNEKFRYEVFVIKEAKPVAPPVNAA